MPTLRQQFQSIAAGATLFCTAWLGLATTAAAAPNNGVVSVAEDPFGAGRVYNLPKVGSSPVNLLTGDMQFSLPLGSIGGRNGLAYMVSARYSSNVMTQASAWNGDQPTGAMGLGWRLDFPKVIVDTHGQTQQSGNDYYLDMDGQRSRLIPSGKDASGNITYTTDTFANWRITYMASAQRWDMVDERGMTWVFGDSSVDAGQNTLQILQVWMADGTMPAPSFGPSTTTSTGSVPVVFNLARIVEPWGDKLTFSYQPTFVQLVGGNGYTRESYLSRVQNSFGDSLRLSYAAKQAGEYVLPHAVNSASKAAYQDRFETQYLTTVSAFKNNGTAADQTVQLSYASSLLNATANPAYGKRLLTAVQSFNGAGRTAVPATRFSHYTSTVNANFGAINTITSPAGSVTTYTYAAVTPALSQLNASMPFDGTGARTWIGENVVIAQSPSTGRTQVFNWQGRWVMAKDLGTLPTDAQVRIGKDTAAVLYKSTSCGVVKDASGACPVLLTLHRDAGTGNWASWQTVIGGNANSPFSNGTNLPDYAGFDFDAGTDTIALAASKASGGQVLPVAMLFHYYSGGFYPINVGAGTAIPNGQASAAARATVRMRDTKAVAWFYAGASTPAYAVMQPDAGGNFVVAWNVASPPASMASFGPPTVDLEMADGYFVVKSAQCTTGANAAAWLIGTESGRTGTAFQVSADLGSTNCAYPPALAGSSIGIGSLQYQIRGAANGGSTSANIAAGPQFGVGTAGASTFSALSNQWQLSTLPVTNTNSMAAGQQFVAFADNGGGTSLYWRQPNDTWQAEAVRLDGSPATGMMSGRKGLVRYNIAAGGRVSYIGSNVADIAVSSATGSSPLSNDARAGASTVGDLSWVDTTLSGALGLRRARDLQPYSVAGTQRVAVVSSITSTTGFEAVANASAPSKTTQYVYDASNATIDPTGRYARFNHVTVREGAGTPGSTNPSDPHYGYTEVWQWNGQADTTPNFTAQPSSNEATTFALLDGRVYYSESWREAYKNGQWVGDSAVGKGWSWYTSTLKDANPDGGYVGGLTSYTRLARTDSQRDGTATVVSVYNYLDASAGDLEGMLWKTTSTALNANNQSETTETAYTYAAQAYASATPAWNTAAHMVSPLAGVVSRRLDNNQLLSSTATTYKAWGTGQAGALWGPVASYAWQRGAASSTFNYAAPNSDWLPGPAVAAVSATGAVTQTQYTYNSPAITVNASTLYDKNGRFPVASFGDATNATGLYWGMEDYEQPALNLADGSGWTAASGTLVSGNVNTGKKALQLTGMLYHGATTVAPSAGAYQLFSAYAYVPKGSSIQLQIAGFKDGVQGLVTSRTVTTADNETAAWKYVEVYYPTAGATAVAPRLFVTGPAVLLDDLRFSPSEAPFSAAVYDLDRGVVTATLGNNGEVLRSLLDEFKRPVASISADGTPVGTAVAYASRLGNNDQFLPSDPNSVAMMAARGAADYADFSGSNPAPGKWTCMPGAGCTPTANGLQFKGNIQLATQVPYGNVVRAQMDYGAVGAGTLYQIQVGDGSTCGGNYGRGVRLSGTQWQWYWCNNGVQTVGGSVAEGRTADQIPRDWLFYSAANRLMFFVGGKKVFDTIDNVGVEADPGHKFIVTVGSNSGTQLTLRNVAVFNDPVFSGSFRDAAGRLLQSTAIVDDKNTINVSNGSFYNANWSRVVQSKAVDYPAGATAFAYLPGYAGRDATGTMTGDVAAKYDNPPANDIGYTNDGGFPYSGINEFTEPASRLSASGQPGSDYSLSGQPATFSYGANAGANGSAPPFTLSSRQGIFPAGQYPVSTGNQPTQDGGNSVQKFVSQTLSTPPGAMIGDMVVNATAYGQPNVQLQTLRSMDSLDRTDAMYHPRYFAPTGLEATPDLFKTQLTYNSYDRVTNVKLPNSGTTQIVYNKVGQLRFWMDANGAVVSPGTSGTPSLQRVSYRKYDRLGRVVEEGYTCGTFDAVALTAMAEDASQPQSNALTWRRKYVYGVTPTQSQNTGNNYYQKGRLAAVRTNSGADNVAGSTADACDASQPVTPEDAQVFTYDARGRLVGVLETTRPYLDGLITGYQYDNLGNVKAIVNPQPVGSGALGQGGTQTMAASGARTQNAIVKVQASPALASQNNVFGLSTAALSALFLSTTDVTSVAMAATTCLSTLPCGLIVGASAAAAAAYILYDPLLVNQYGKAGTQLNAGVVVPAGSSLQVNPAVALPSITTLYAYDRLGRLASIGRSVDGATPSPAYYATYRYGVNGELLGEVRNNDVSGNNAGVDAPINLAYEYNSPGMLKSLTARLGTATWPIYQQTLYYNDAPAGYRTYDGRIGKMTQVFTPSPSNQTQGTLDQLFTYYPEGGVKAVSSQGTNLKFPLGATAFNFAVNDKDANGNLRKIVQGSSPYALNVRSDSDRLNQVLNANGTVKSAYTYDANGNVVSKTNHINNISYDPFYNRAVTINHVTQSQPQMSYTMRYGGAGGQRVWQTYYDQVPLAPAGTYAVNVENTYFSGGGGNPLVIQYDTAKVPGQQAPQISRKTMIWGPTGLVAVADTSGGALKDYFVVPNHQGSTVQVWQKGNFTNGVQSYYYTPSGNIYLPNGGLVTQSQTVPFLYQGTEYDWQSELHNFGMRSYDSDMVNMMQPDPQFSVGQSPYVAMDNDPVN